MRKIEVLRSDQSIRNSISLIRKETKGKTISKSEEDTLKISDLLKESGIRNTEIETLVEESASTQPLIGSRNMELMTEPEVMVPDDREVYTFEYSYSIKNNKPLENNYIDEIRGNVIKVDSHDSTYMREFDCNDHIQILSTGQAALTNTHDQYKKFFLITDVINNNKISNCFQGQDLSHGASLSFWVKFFSLDTAKNCSGLIAFLGDHEKHYFDEEAKDSEMEYIDYTTHLAVTTDLSVEYNEAFDNHYVRKRNNSYLTNGQNRHINKALWRSNKAWMHVILSFTNDGIERFINGMQVADDYMIKRGKRFAMSVPGERTGILDFLRDDKTTLYLGMTLDETKTSDAMLFDDITFWDMAVSGEKQAQELFEEAKKINLP